MGVQRASAAGQTTSKLHHSNFVQPADHATSDAANTQAFVSPFEAKAARVMLERYLNALGKYGKSGNVQKTEAMLVEMRLKGLTPTGIAYQHLILAYAKNKDPVRAQRIIDELQLSGIPLNNRLMSNLIMAYANAGDIVGADKSYEDAIAAKVLPGTAKLS